MKNIIFCHFDIIFCHFDIYDCPFSQWHSDCIKRVEPAAEQPLNNGSACRQSKPTLKINKQKIGGQNYVTNDENKRMVTNSIQ